MKEIQIDCSMNIQIDDEHGAQVKRAVGAGVALDAQAYIHELIESDADSGFFDSNHEAIAQLIQRRIDGACEPAPASITDLRERVQTARDQLAQL